jgi:hypothetical protein
MNFLKKLVSKKVEETPEAPPEFLQENPPDWLIDLKGQEPPDGNHFSIRIQLFQTNRSGSAEILVLPRDQSGQPKNATTDLTRPELDRLFVILGFSFPDEIATVSTDAGDGLPITISIYRRNPFTHRAAGCDLAAWLDSRKSGPPVVEIGRIALESRQRILPL